MKEKMANIKSPKKDVLNLTKEYIASKEFLSTAEEIFKDNIATQYAKVCKYFKEYHDAGADFSVWGVDRTLSFSKSFAKYDYSHDELYFYFDTEKIAESGKYLSEYRLPREKFYNFIKHWDDFIKWFEPAYESTVKGRLNQNKELTEGLVLSSVKDFTF